MCVCLKRKQRKSTRGATKTIIHIQKLFAIPSCTHTLAREHPYRIYSHTFHLQVRCTVIKRNCNEKTSRNRHTHAIVVVPTMTEKRKKKTQRQHRKSIVIVLQKGQQPEQQQQKHQTFVVLTLAAAAFATYLLPLFLVLRIFNIIYAFLTSTHTSMHTPHMHTNTVALKCGGVSA